VSSVSVSTEWDPLEEVVVGRAANARIARPDRGLLAVEYRDYGSPDRIPSGRYPERVVAETEEDLDAYAALYEKSGFRYPLQIPYR
jgi:glycine amidinotransferase/scyllo-inosamine-4-phosphate amidinotransferase 1